MPAVVKADVGGESPSDCRELQRDLLATFRADFAKYSGRMNRDILDLTLAQIAGAIGQKFVYARVGEGVKSHQAKRALDLLCSARLCHNIHGTSANSLPLGGEKRTKFRKVIMADVGLLHALIGTPATNTFPATSELAPAVRGQIAEQLAGQQLRLLGETSGDGPELYYWQREGGRLGEIDYLAQIGTQIIPIEIKSGSAGAMKGLH